MSKATIDELKAEQFNAAQFGMDEGSTWDNYLQALLDEQAFVVQERVGAAVYASSDAVVVNRIKRTERFLAAAELWLRRMNQIESDVSVSGESNRADFQRYENNYKSYYAKARAELAALPSASAIPTEASSVPALGVAVTSHFRQNGVAQ